MNNALRVGSVARIGIYLHWTFGLLIVGLFVFYLTQGSTVGGALLGVGLILAVFGCVVLHELGHALTARRFGVPTRDITLYPIGGVARLQRVPEEPMEEFWIAIAGPAVNLVIAALLAVGIGLTGGSWSPGALVDPSIGFGATLLWLNLILAGFNLLPAFPMDGGRILRALLALRIEYARATQIAANIGQGMAILFGIVGLLGFNPILLFIALFVYIGAQQEARQALVRSLTQGVSVREAMLTRFRVLHPSDTLDVAVQELLAGSEQDFPVVEDETILGILTRKQLLQALAEGGRTASVREAKLEACFTIEDAVMLDDVFTRMQETGCSAVPVVRGGHLVGMLTLENVGELLMVTSAMRTPGARPVPVPPSRIPPSRIPLSAD